MKQHTHPNTIFLGVIFHIIKVLQNQSLVDFSDLISIYLYTDEQSQQQAQGKQLFTFAQSFLSFGILGLLYKYQNQRRVDKTIQIKYSNFLYPTMTPAKVSNRNIGSIMPGSSLFFASCLIYLFSFNDMAYGRDPIGGAKRRTYKAVLTKI